MASADSPVFLINVRRDNCPADSGSREVIAPPGQRVRPLVVKNHRLAVIQSAVNPLRTVPPRAGSAQPGESSRVKISILVTNAPKKKQPTSECARTRPL